MRAARLYFFRTSLLADQKWGTTTPIKYDDPKYKFPVGLRAHGNFSFAFKDMERFFAKVVGQSDLVTVDQVRTLIVSRLMTPIQDFLAEKKFSYADIDANLVEIAAGVKALTAKEFDPLGFELHDFRINGTSFDDKTQERIGRIADMTAEAQAAAAVGLNYAQMQQLGALRDAARNEGGMAGAGVGIGAGIGLGQQMAQAMNNTAGGAGGANDPQAKLQKLKSMLDAGLITAADFEKKKAEILASL